MSRRQSARCLVALLLVVSAPALVHAATALDQLKSSIVGKLGDYVEWPQDGGPQGGTGAILCVLGQSALSFGGRSVGEVKAIGSTEEFGTCHVVYVAPGRSDIPEIAKAAKRRRILTVSDMEGFAEAGGMIELIDRGGRIALAVNLDAAKDAGLKVSRATAAAQRIFTKGKWIEVR